MRRRDFLRSTGLVSTSLLLPGFLKAMGGAPGTNGRRLVVLQLSGGNDGLNTIVPFRDDAYRIARPKLGIAQDKVLRLTDDIALNPSLAALRKLYDDGLLTLINGVGYPNPDRSHFRSMDIWQSGSASNEVLTTGWLGRYLDSECRHPHDIIEFGSRLSLANKGERDMAIALTDPQRFFAATREPYFAKLASSGEHDHDHPPLGYLYKTMVETYQSAGYINATLKPREPSAIYPKGELGSQLRTIASFIRSGMETRVYYASTGGFDTHVNQAGKHERVLGGVGEALGAFTADLKANGLLDDTLIMVFSEFGRRVKQNASGGTDHGTAGNVWLVGDKLGKTGVFNNIPSLTDLDDNGDLKYAVDFRSIYGTVLERWLAVDRTRILTRPVPLLPGLLV